MVRNVLLKLAVAIADRYGYRLTHDDGRRSMETLRLVRDVQNRRAPPNRERLRRIANEMARAMLLGRSVAW